LKISEALESETHLPLWIGTKKVGAEFTQGDWAGLLASTEQCIVLDMGGGRGQFYLKSGKKGSKLEFSTNTLFADGAFTEIRDDYIDTMTAFFKENNITTEDKLVMKFTGKARNYNSLEFLEALQIALNNNGYPNVSASYISIQEEGAPEM
jgi:hypothetical protein